MTQLTSDADLTTLKTAQADTGTETQPDSNPEGGQPDINPQTNQTNTSPEAASLRPLEGKPKPAETTSESFGTQDLLAAYEQNGSLSEDVLAKAEASGLRRDLAQAAVAGWEAQKVEMISQQGGVEIYEKAVAWGNENLSEGEIKVFNAALNSFNIDAIGLAVSGLVSKYQKAGNGTQKVLDGQGGTGSSTGEQVNFDALLAAHQDERWQKDPAWRQQKEEAYMNYRKRGGK